MAAVSDEKRQANTEVNRVKNFQVSTNDSVRTLDPSVPSSTRTFAWHTVVNWMYYEQLLTMADNYAFLISGVLCSAIGTVTMIMSCFKSQWTKSFPLPGLKTRHFKITDILDCGLIFLATVFTGHTWFVYNNNLQIFFSGDPYYLPQRLVNYTLDLHDRNIEGR